PITGTFAQGNTVSAGNVTYSVTYNTNSVVLTAATVVTPTKLIFTSVPSTATAGTPTTIIIAATDASGNTAGGDNDMVTLSTSAGAGNVSPTTVQLTNGTAAVPITLLKSGLQTLTAHDTSLPLTDGTASITVNP